VSRSDSGFATETNKVTIIDSRGKMHPLPLKTKDEVANIILERVVEILRERGHRRRKP